MAVVIEANYSKKLGLPAYSSHSYSVTIRSEVADLSQAERESSKLYSILQGSVDREIQEVGFVPEANSHGSSIPRSANGHSPSYSDQWACSDKQRELILKIRDEHKLQMDQIEEISKQLFQRPAKTLNKLEASVLIKELLEEFGPKGAPGNGNGRRPLQQPSRR
jgi:hypothetical protein